MSRESKYEAKVECCVQREEIVREAMAFCFSQGFSELFESFMHAKAKYFYDSVAKTFEEEHTFEQKQVYDEYLDLYESTLSSWLESKKMSLAQFSEAVKEANLRGDSGERFFIKLLRASTEYECFFEVMQGEARFQLWKKEQDQGNSVETKTRK